MTAVPTRSMAHRALVHWDETRGNLPLAACACAYPCTPVPRYSCTFATHFEKVLGGPLPEVLVRGTSKATSNLGRPNAGEQLDGRGGKTRPSQQTMHRPLVLDQIESSPVESSRAIGHRVPRRGRRTEHTNQTPSPPRQSPCRPSCHGQVSRLSTAHLTVRGHATALLMPTRPAAGHCL